MTSLPGQTSGLPQWPFSTAQVSDGSPESQDTIKKSKIFFKMESGITDMKEKNCSINFSFCNCTTHLNDEVEDFFLKLYIKECLMLNKMSGNGM